MIKTILLVAFLAINFTKSLPCNTSNYELLEHESCLMINPANDPNFADFRKRQSYPPTSPVPLLEAERTAKNIGAYEPKNYQQNYGYFFDDSTFVNTASGHINYEIINKKRSWGYNHYIEENGYDVIAINSTVFDTGFRVQIATPACKGYRNREIIGLLVGKNQSGFPDLGLPSDAPSKLVNELPAGLSVLAVIRNIVDDNGFVSFFVTAYWFTQNNTCLNFGFDEPDCNVNVLRFDTGELDDDIYYAITYEKNGKATVHFTLVQTKESPFDMPFDNVEKQAQIDVGKTDFHQKDIPKNINKCIIRDEGVTLDDI